MTRKEPPQGNIPNAHIQQRDLNQQDSAAYDKNNDYLKQMALQNAKWFPAPPPHLPAAKPPAPSRPSIDYKSWISSLSSLVLLLGIGAGVTGAGWLSVQFLMNPRSVIWVNNYLPEPLQLKVAGWDQPRTMKEITADLKKSGMWFGDQIRLGNDSKTAEFMVPVFQTQEDCLEDCQKIVELRVYRPVAHPYRKTKEQHFRMVSQLPVLGMEDWFVQEPFVNAQVDVPPPSEAILSFDSVEVLSENAPKEGIWLTLKGERNQIGTYGQILHYDPRKVSLTAMIPWTSPDREMPRWENLTLGGSPELIVDQTIGLEPLFKVYLLEPDRSNLSGFKLRAVSLTKPVLEARSYTDALKLAKNGLWSLAAKALESLGEDAFKDNVTAQLQRDVIRYHAQIFKAQSEQASASTSQQVQADLLDGRWDKAIKVVKAAPDDREEVIDLLNSDSGQILKRLKAALEIDPGNSALQAWNAAMKLARSGKGSAIAWLKTQPNSGDRSKMLADLAPSLNPTPKPITPTSSTASPPSISPTAEPYPASTTLPVENSNPLNSSPAIGNNNQIESAPRAVDPSNYSTDPIPPRRLGQQ